MNTLRKVTYLLISFAALAAALAMMIGTAHAQSDPFGALYAPPPGDPGTPAPSTRTGVTSVNTAVGRSYAGAQEGGYASLAQIGMLPDRAAPFALRLKAWNPRFAAGRPRVIVPSYALALVRTGKVSAFSAGQGTEMVGRRTSIATALVGVSDDLARDLAEEAWQDLVSRLKVAGFDVVTPAELAKSAEFGRLTPVGVQAKGVNGWSVYGPVSAPLRTGHPYADAVLGASRASIVYNDVSAELDAVVLSPMLAIDYQELEGSGRKTYSGSAQAEAEVRFNVLGGSGANFLYGKRKGLGGGMPGSFTLTNAHGSSEAFGIMYEVDDRSDSVALHNAFAQAGMGSLYRQSKVYAVEVDARRYRALVRAAFQGLNAALVAELKAARGRV
ncbi:MAG: hypothetical protein Q8L66_15685 [Caulobacter sp.]|nr:hypothetical protein [Caulobacter sp.]